jgi:hypothetical protein
MDAINKACLQDPQNWLFQEDGNPSHGLCGKGLAYHLKRANWINNIAHPVQSPDLNPIEGIWSILKQ